MLCVDGRAVASTPAPDEIPHRRGALVIDGDLGDWGPRVLRVELAEPDLPAPAANRATVLLSWDRSQLYVGFDVIDHELIAPPAQVSPDALYQFDGVELYVDSRGDAGTRMGTDDFQFLVGSDGQLTVFQGDPIVASDPGWTVPKNVRESVILDVAARETAEGYQVELAIPFTALGIDQPQEGTRLGIDLAWNDWTEAHDELPTPDLSIDTMALGGNMPLLFDEAQAALVERAYHPWGWSESRDMGYPDQWHALRLTGRPGLGEALAQRLQAWSLPLAAVVLLLGLTGLFLALREHAHRRRIRALTDQLERRRDAIEAAVSQPRLPALTAVESTTLWPAEAVLDAAGGVPFLDDSSVDPETITAPPAPPNPATESLAGRFDRMLMDVHEADDTPMGLSLRALSYVRDHLDRKITVGQLSTAVHVSPRSLQRAIREALGCSPRELILAVKMHEAKYLLRTHKMRVSDVAYRLGFENPNHFSSRFKTYYRVPPSQVGELDG